jgi:hypothetical protein
MIVVEKIAWNPMVEVPCKPRIKSKVERMGEWVESCIMSSRPETSTKFIGMDGHEYEVRVTRK